MTKLFDIAALVSGALAAIVTEAPATTWPDRQFVWAGDLSFDCEEFVAHGVQITQGLPGAASSATDPVRQYTSWAVQFGLTVVRCVPVDDDGQPSDAVSYAALGLKALEDGGALLRYAISAHRKGVFIPTCDAVMIGPVQWGGPLGGVIGTTLLVTAQIG